MAPCRRSYILLVQNLQTSEMLDKWCLTSKLSDIKFSHIADGRFFYIWYLQIFSRVFPWLNFEYCIKYRLCWFKCKPAALYVLLHFFYRSYGLVFLLTLLEFSLTEFLQFFFRCSFLLSLRKKMSPQTQSKISIHNIVFQEKDYMTHVFGCFFWETISLILAWTLFLFF